MRPLLLKRDIISALGLLFTIGILFSPMIKLYDASGDTPNVIIFGLSTIGNVPQFTALEFGKSFQLMLVVVVLMTWILSFHLQEKYKLLTFVLISLVLIIFPAWLMTFVEGTVKNLAGGHLQLEFSYGFLFLALSLICSTIGIVNLDPKARLQPATFQESAILDD